MFFISGLTGKVGGAAAQQLLKDGHKVRTLVRDVVAAAPGQSKESKSVVAIGMTPPLSREP